MITNYSKAQKIKINLKIIGNKRMSKLEEQRNYGGMVNTEEYKAEKQIN